MKNCFVGMGLAVLIAVSMLFAGSAAAETDGETTRVLKLEDMREKYQNTASAFETIEGIEVHYRDEGQGPALLLVHGTLGDLADWDVWAEHLTDNFRVVRFDIPSFGLTGQVANKNYSVERVHTLMDGLMDHLGIQRFGIVGISYGGLVSFRYAATRTDRITSLVLINSAGIQTGQKAKAATAASKGNFLISPVVTREDIETFYANYINDEAMITPELVQRKLDFLNIRERDQEAIYSYGFYEKGDPQRVLAHVKAPSLIMWGTANNALDTETAQAFVDALTRAPVTDLITFEDGGHYINLERPVDTVLAAKEWLWYHNRYWHHHHHRGPGKY